MEERWFDRFPSLKGKCYLVSCSRGPQSVDVRNAIDSYLESWADRASPYSEWQQVLDDSATAFAGIIGAERKEIAHSFSVSTAITTLLSSFDYKSRNEIIVSEVDFPTISTIMLAQERLGARIRVVKSKEAKVDLNDLKEKISEKTLLVNLPCVNSKTGIQQEVDSIIEISHKMGAFVLADAYQFAGAGELSVRNQELDFLVCGTLKYLLGTPGCAFLYVSKQLIESLKPSSTGWLSQVNPAMFGRTDLDYSQDASRFETGTWAIPSVYAAHAGMKIILEVGLRRISEQLRKLNNFAIDTIDKLVLNISSKTRKTSNGPFVSLFVKEPDYVRRRLAEENIFVSPRNDVIRIAPHFMNDEVDIEKALRAIKKVVA